MFEPLKLPHVALGPTPVSTQPPLGDAPGSHTTPQRFETQISPSMPESQSALVLHDFVHALCGPQVYAASHPSEQGH